MTHGLNDPFGARDTLRVGDAAYVVYRLDRIAAQAGADLARLPFSVRVLLEALLRNVGDGFTSEEDVLALARWTPDSANAREVQFKPSRVLLQDFTGVPAVVDLAAMRDAMQQLGGDPARINPLSRADLVIDHSVQVDLFGTNYALMFNAEREFERNRERYEFLRWGQQAFDNFTVVPPATGICHQVNLEYLATVVQTKQSDGETIALPDSLVGTDSHTTMVNGLGVLGWGVGGIEAEAVLLGQPLAMLTPAVIGVRLTGKLRPGATATDLVLAVTEMLRREGVVGKFVEYYGTGLSNLTVADRATLSNMCPEYGATAALFPIDEQALAGRDLRRIPELRQRLIGPRARSNADVRRHTASIDRRGCVSARGAGAGGAFVLRQLLQRDGFGQKAAFGQRLLRAGERFKGIAVLIGAGKAEGRRAVLGEVAHRAASLIGVFEPVKRHVIMEPAMAEAIAAARLIEQIGRVAHALHAARDDDGRTAGADHVMPEHHRLHARSADLAHRGAGNGLGQPRAQRGLAGRRLAQTGRQHATHQHLVHALCRQGDLLEGPSDCRSPQRGGRARTQRTLEAADRRPCRPCDDDPAHGRQPSPACSPTGTVARWLWRGQARQDACRACGGRIVLS